MRAESDWGDEICELAEAFDSEHDITMLCPEPDDREPDSWRLVVGVRRMEARLRLERLVTQSVRVPVVWLETGSIELLDRPRPRGFHEKLVIRLWEFFLSSSSEDLSVGNEHYDLVAGSITAVGTAEDSTGDEISVVLSSHHVLDRGAGAGQILSPARRDDPVGDEGDLSVNEIGALGPGILNKSLDVSSCFPTPKGLSRVEMQIGNRPRTFTGIAAADYGEACFDARGNRNRKSMQKADIHGLCAVAWVDNYNDESRRGFCHQLCTRLKSIDGDSGGLLIQNGCAVGLALAKTEKASLTFFNRLDKLKGAALSLNGQNFVFKDLVPEP